MHILYLQVLINTEEILNLTIYRSVGIHTTFQKRLNIGHIKTTAGQKWIECNSNLVDEFSFIH